MVWPKGAEWRKWDLHVHSPASYNFSGDHNQFIIQLGGADCDVIGINDYFSVAGYREVLRHLHAATGAIEGNQAYRDALEKLRAKTLIPVVECRMSNILRSKKASGPRINFHLIFDPEIDPDNIETFLKGQSVDESQVGHRYADSQFLLDHVAVDFKAICQQLRNSGMFRDHHLVWLPYDEYGGIDEIDPASDGMFKENLIRNAHILGSANKKQADFFLWKDERFTEAEYRGWFGNRKPCIKGSDSHRVNDDVGRLKDNKSQPTNRYCWIKADPTFNGLKQITNEPEDRVYIGRIPPKLETVHSEPTRFIEKLVIRKAAGADVADAWFDCELPLSPDMVAIIGNKGSGKSALADIIALSGNALCDPQHFSFLTKNRFCERNGKLAKHFEVVSAWSDGTEGTISLFAKADINGVELVRYIPQTYLEKVCTEMEPGQESEFQLELRKVIFSHISDADRLGKETLDDLIRYKTEELNAQIGNARREVTRINGEMIRLEERGSAAHRARIDAALAVKRQELKAHIENKPTPVEQPENVTDEQKAAINVITTSLGIERAALDAIDTTMAQQVTSQKNLAEQIAAARKVEGKVDIFEAEHGRLQRETEADLVKVGVAFADLVTVTIDKTPLVRKRDALIVDKTAVDLDLAVDNPEGAYAKKTGINERIKALQERLDAPNKYFQAYNEALRLWAERQQVLEGSADTPETEKWYEAQLNYIDTELPQETTRLKKQRRRIVEDIHRCVADIRDIYTELFAAVQDLISSSVIIKEGFKLTFESRIVDRSFQKDLFERFVSQGSAGSFYNKEKGAVMLEELRADVDFNDAAETMAFVEKVLEYLQTDMRGTQRTKTGIASQLRKSVDVKALYDFLWSFGYLEPEYSLKLDGKDLSHLSPGERGTLLLVFYLLVDKSNKPIIVDQPEENLDSQTVYNLLRPVIKDVKKRRQIVMVTHSPNIAVVCDAEQIIHAHIDRAAGNKVIYTTGAIESPAINRFLVNVLEGTRPAFDNRDSKYHPE
jgi:ABC-type lipoprotein export system ATPase subunit